MKSFLGLFAAILSASFLFTGAAFGQKATMSAEIKGTDGRPAKGAEIRIERLDQKMNPVIAHADGRGKWSTTDLTAGRYKVTAVLPGNRQSSQIVQANANKRLLVTFDMKQVPGQASATGKKKTFVWVDPSTGSHMGGHFEEVGGQARDRGPQVGGVDSISGETLNRISRTGAGQPSTGGR